MIAKRPALVLFAVLLGFGAAQSVATLRHVSHAATVMPSPSPTPCDVVYVDDDGRESCLVIPSAGTVPFP